MAHKTHRQSILPNIIQGLTETINSLEEHCVAADIPQAQASAAFPSAGVFLSPSPRHQASPSSFLLGCLFFGN